MRNCLGTYDPSKLFKLGVKNIPHIYRALIANEEPMPFVIACRYVVVK